MRRRPSVSTSLAVLLAAALLVPAAATGQDDASDAWQAPRTPNGRPDLQGVWDFRSLTPLERPEALADQDVFSAEEAAQFTEERLAALDKDQPGPDGRIPLSGGYNDFWWDYGRQLTGDLRTSLLVDPPDGRLPALTPAARDRAAARRTALGRDAYGPEDRGAFERCILGFNAGPPMNPSAYNNNMQLFQTADHMVILNEMVHDARIVPLDGSGHLPDGVRQWRGDSRGHWDGDTLVIETKNFTAQDVVPRHGPRTAPGRAVHAHGGGNPPLRVHRHRSRVLRARLVGRRADAEERSAGLRVRLPRRELRDAEPDGERPGRGREEVRGGRRAVTRCCIRCRTEPARLRGAWRDRPESCRGGSPPPSS